MSGPSGSSGSRPAPGFAPASSILASNQAASTSATSASSSQPRNLPIARANSNNAVAGPSNVGASAAAKGKAPVRAGSGAKAVVNGGGAAAGGSGGSGGSGGAGRVVNVGGAAAGPGGVVRRPTLNAIVVNTCQKGNPIIAHIRNVAWEYGDIVPDYQVGATTGLLFLSLRYHLLHPEYIHNRIEKIGQTYSLRLMLVMCDVDNYTAAIRELTKVCIVNGYTMIVCWTAQEAGRYLELYKSFERKPPDMIKERVEKDYMSHLSAALTSVRGVNKTDVTTLASNFGSFHKIITATPESLGVCPGLGEKKVKRLRDACTGSFVLRSKKKKKSMAEEMGEKGNALN